MKKLFTVFFLTIVLLTTLTYNSNAQFKNRGTIEVGGTISYTSVTAVSNGTTDNNSSSMFNFTPMLSYFVVDGFYLGVSPGINIVKVAGSDNPVTNLMLFAVPGYAFGKGDVFPFVEGWLGYSALNSDGVSFEGTSSGKLELSGLSYGARGGVKLQVGKGGLVNMGLSYIAYTFNAKGADKRTGMNTLAFVIGFSVFFGK